ncbi:ISL3 family transposase, partial [Phocoenobacter atlanticus]
VEQALSEQDLSTIEQIGIDETSIAKGHSYISLFVDLYQRRTIHISEGKGSDTICDFVAHLTKQNGTAEQVKEVSCDMSPAFIKGVSESLPEAKITFDKFHILKLINEAVDSVRRTEAKTNPLLKGNRYTVLKNDANLTAKQREAKSSLSKLNLKTMRAVSMRETFQQLYSSPDLFSFEQALKRWYFWATHSQLSPMIKVAKTIKKHWNGVLRWVDSKINNGILEGLNSVLQAAKRKARGYKVKHFKTMAFLLTGKLDFTAQNPYLPT